MPELPEVEVVRRGLERWVTGRALAEVEVAHPRVVRRHVAGPADFAARLAGRSFGAAMRRGKYLWLPLEADEPAAGGEALVAHLGMSGQLLVGAPDRPMQRHMRARFSFADGGADLRFVDQRTFGGMFVAELSAAACHRTRVTSAVERSALAGAVLPAPIAHIAPDPLAADFDAEAFTAALRGKRTELKRALLDQSLISGIGNIYADEALWRARLHGRRPTPAITGRQVGGLVGAVGEVMRAALAVGGTTFDSLYVNVNGESGYFERDLAVYGRAGLPCRRCGTTIVRESFMNRGSFYCPACQRAPRSVVARRARGSAGAVET